MADKFHAHNLKMNRGKKVELIESAASLRAAGAVNMARNRESRSSEDLRYVQPADQLFGHHHRRPKEKRAHPRTLNYYSNVIIARRKHLRQRGDDIVKPMQGILGLGGGTRGPFANQRQTYGIIGNYKAAVRGQLQRNAPEPMARIDQMNIRPCNARNGGILGRPTVAYQPVPEQVPQRATYKPMGIIGNYNKLASPTPARMQDNQQGILRQNNNGVIGRFVNAGRDVGPANRNRSLIGHDYRFERGKIHQSYQPADETILDDYQMCL